VRWFHAGIILLLLVLVTFRLVRPALEDPEFGILVDTQKGGGWTSDFAAHLTFAKAFWSGKAGYDVQSHLRITSERFRRPVEHALPFGYSPTMLWMLGPLCPLPPAWAYTVWTLAAIAAIWWMTLPERSVWMAAAFFSPVAFTCFGLGQTAFLTAAGMLFLMIRTLNVQTQPSGRWTTSRWAEAIVLWGLTAKPPAALTAGAVMLGNRRWRPLALAVGLSLLSTVLLTPRLGLHWIAQYVHLLTHYDLETADPAFTWSLAPKTMGNLRALLHVTFGFGDAAASRWSNGLWWLALAGITAASLRRRLPAQASWGLAVLAYLLLCAHVTSTEELHLVLLIALVAQASQKVPNGVRWATVALVMAVLYLPPGIGYQGPLRIPAVFTSKVLLALLVWTQWRRSPSVRRLDLGSDPVERVGEGGTVTTSPL
jgi:hypothetical protein